MMHQGFRVRMRTVFVPYFLLPQDSQNGMTQKPRKASGSGSDTDDSDSEVDLYSPNPMDEIIPNLWIGNLLSALNEPSLRANNIGSVLSVMRGRMRVHEVCPLQRTAHQ